MAKLATLDDNESAFLDYVKGMRNSVGKRFIVNHIEHYGFEAFDSFWEKLKDARYGDPPQLELNEQEQRSLARAIHATSRRAVLQFALGTGLAFVGMNLLKSGANNGMDASSHNIPIDDTLLVFLKLSSGAVATISGIALMFRDNEPSSHTVATIAKGEDGEKNIRQLVGTLDNIFKPIELSLDETRPGRY